MAITALPRLSPTSAGADSYRSASTSSTAESGVREVRLSAFQSYSGFANGESPGLQPQSRGCSSTCHVAATSSAVSTCFASLASLGLPTRELGMDLPGSTEPTMSLFDGIRDQLKSRRTGLFSESEEWVTTLFDRLARIQRENPSEFWELSLVQRALSSGPLEDGDDANLRTIWRQNVLSLIGSTCLGGPECVRILFDPAPQKVQVADGLVRIQENGDRDLVRIQTALDMILSSPTDRSLSPKGPPGLVLSLMQGLRLIGRLDSLENLSRFPWQVVWAVFLDGLCKTCAISLPQENERLIQGIQQEWTLPHAMGRPRCWEEEIGLLGSVSNVCKGLKGLVAQQQSVAQALSKPILGQNSPCLPYVSEAVTAGRIPSGSPDLSCAELDDELTTNGSQPGFNESAERDGRSGNFQFQAVDALWTDSPLTAQQTHDVALRPPWNRASQTLWAWMTSPLRWTGKAIIGFLDWIGQESRHEVEDLLAPAAPGPERPDPRS